NCSSTLRKTQWATLVKLLRNARKTTPHPHFRPVTFVSDGNATTDLCSYRECLPYRCHHNSFFQ
ncbi:hypothetical protein L9F63_010777, partial [Diploptera punctata]